MKRMNTQPENPDSIRSANSGWIRYILLALTVEKIIQHIYVTLAFYSNWGNIDATVAVNPDVLMILGAVIAALLILSLWGLITRNKWAVNLIIGLALFDIIGEFIAQGTIFIQLNISFLVATALLILALIYRRKEIPGRR